MLARVLAASLVLFGALVVLVIFKPTLLLNVGGEELADSLMRELDGGHAGSCHRIDEPNTWRCDLVAGGSDQQTYELVTDGDCWEARDLGSTAGARDKPRKNRKAISGCVSIVDFNPLAVVGTSGY